MIGVIAGAEETNSVCEFFELFKTPWEFYRDGTDYDVVLISGGSRFEGTAKLVVVYSSSHTVYDDFPVSTGSQRKQRLVLSYRGNRIPIYGTASAFPGAESSFLIDEESKIAVSHQKMSSGTLICRVGYDLFNELRTLLTVGQPASNAEIPTLELHIALLRDLITSSGLSLSEIPPVPEGYNCIVCLTHDIDHPLIRQHVWDHTICGFLYRAVVGSLRNLARGRISVRDLCKNWAAAFKLPFVYCGLAKDFWGSFDDSYLNLEGGLKSTFFVIPFRDRAGIDARGVEVQRRAAKYAAKDIARALRRLQNAGREIGLHGIDAWRDSSAGREEIGEICRLTGNSEIGGRMHWLYFDHQSPAILEEAGLTYDSSVGYNETVGYRAGTTQPYKPINASRLLELPLHVMDTALFYPAYLDLSPSRAKEALYHMAENAVQFGGCFTINWHDRSTAPERLWGTPYRELIEHLKGRGAWFATAGEVVAWFRKRRSAVWEVKDGADAMAIKTDPEQGGNLPGLQIRVHRVTKPPDLDHQDFHSQGTLRSSTAEEYRPCIANR